MISVLFGALAGLAVSPMLRAATARHAVPYGEPPGWCCPAGRYGRWPNGGCPGCGTRLGPAVWLIEPVAVAIGGAIGSVAHWPSVLALSWVGLFGVVLAFTDLAVERLPDALTLPLGAGTAVLLLLTEHQGATLMRCLYAALAFGAFYGALALFAPIGLGDVKLAPTVGALLGWYGWRTVEAGFFLGFLLAGGWGGALLLSRRAKRGHELPFGPWMLLGALLAVLIAAG